MADVGGLNIIIENNVIRDNSIEQHLSDVDGASIAVNYLGYAGGSTRYRDFDVYDGKGAAGWVRGSS